MGNPLAFYLNDHLGGANLAVELLEKWRTESGDAGFRRFSDDLLSEIEQDREELRRVIQTTGEDGSSIKEAIGWLAEKAIRLKLGTGGNEGLARFEGLEFLSLGISGKLALWQMLAVLSESNARLDGFDFRRLASRALSQRNRVERRRLVEGRAVFSAPE